MFTLVSLVIFTLLFMQWRSDDFLNFTIKLGLFIMVAWGLYLVINGVK